MVNEHFFVMRSTVISTLMKEMKNVLDIERSLFGMCQLQTIRYFGVKLYLK